MLAIKGLRYAVHHFDFSEQKSESKKVTHGVKYLELVSKTAGAYLFRVILVPGRTESKLLDLRGRILKLKTGQTLAIDEPNLRRLTTEGTMRLIRDEPVAMDFNPTDKTFPFA
jgi:hypothetical protein